MNKSTALIWHMLFTGAISFVNAMFAVYQATEARFIASALILYFAYYLAKDVRKTWQKRKKLIHNLSSRSLNSL